jgi:hypothetical protein
MKHSAWIRIVLSTLALGAAVANAAVVVSFVDDDHYTDARADGYTRTTATEAIERHLRALGARYLTPQQTLRVEVLDIDLAGTMETTKRATQMRVLRDNGDGPSIRLRYWLESGGKVLASGEETLADRSYIRLRKTIGADSESMYYEKRMLDEWFKLRFVERTPK